MCLHALTSSLKKYVIYNWLINNILYFPDFVRKKGWRR